ncbi:sensory box histidine kinase/response regulator [Paramagnetospirillum magnetotacticum MS-1]|uniref:histidine kinase n=1 Tax=Paramagnetospirillum magnetotacticum MS-1 TaxID=272627 RepID=A0A0C2YEZ8_PARME|nr:ATP-binding protein [Paramagnetospirillum magnetotacticum]KIL98294.1 sensory box histidine kinase/response regulator [Paramagnetospirillum magnetotacticum MS-1]
MTSAFPGLNPGDPGYWEVIFDVIPFPVYVADCVTHDIICTNRAMRQKVGVVQGRKCYESIYNHAAPCRFCKMPEMLASESDVSLEFEHFNDRDDRWYQLRETSLTWFDGRRAKYSIAVDISALKGFQNALAEAHAELALKNRDLEKAVTQARDAERAKSEFLAVMSHEIRTPMNSILGMVHLLMDRPLAAEDREKLSVVHDSGAALLGIINDILDFSRLEADGVQFEDAPFHLGNTVEGVVSLLRGRATEKNLTLALDAPSPLPGWVSGDGARLRQVLINLVGNAIKFTTQGGVVLRLRRDGEGNRYEFSVIDTGIGLEAEQAKNLFQPFHQADASISRRFGGSGLGLAICKKLVDAQGGKIGVDSTKGLGSRFWFHLDYPDTAAPAAQSPRAEISNLPSLSILLAEDNVFNQKVAAGLLNREGHRVTLANNGLEALEKLQDGRFDLILMDMQMPEMDGPEATRRIRGLPGALAAIPIIALTANAMADDVARCRAAGMDGHVAKPIDPLLLRAAIAEVLPRHAPEARAGERSSYSIARMAEQLGSDNAAILARTFIESGEDICNRLENAGGDIQVTGAALHELKGLAAYSGTPWLEALAISMSKALEDSDMPQVEGLLHRLRRDWNNTRAELTRQFGL